MGSREQHVGELSSLLQQLRDSWGTDGSADTGKQNERDTEDNTGCFEFAVVVVTED